MILAVLLFLGRVLVAGSAAEKGLVRASGERGSLLKSKSRVRPIVGVFRSCADGVVGKIGL